MTNTVICKIPRSFDTFIYFLKSDLAPSVSVPIYVNDFPDINIPFIYFQTEQLTRQEFMKRLVDNICKKAPLEVWDYSKINVDIFKGQGIKAKHIQVQTPDPYKSKLLSWRTDEYDVGFCGWMKSPRRRTIIEGLKQAGLRVNIIEQHGEIRDKELAKCRVLINIHFENDFNVFEVARCEPWLSIGVPVISEHSLDDDDRCINVKYDDLVSTVVKYIKNGCV
jgi:hypothetical protein